MLTVAVTGAAGVGGMAAIGVKVTELLAVATSVPAGMGLLLVSINQNGNVFLHDPPIVNVVCDNFGEDADRTISAVRRT